MHVNTLIRIFPRRCTAAAYCFSSSLEAARSPLKVGDVLRETRRFSAGDVAVYAEVSGDRNPVHLSPDVALRIGGFERGSVVHGMLVASLFPSVISSNFVGFPSLLLLLSIWVKFRTKCFGSQETLLMDGEAMAILPTLIRSQ
ncbi:transcription initiation factor TFIID subunit 9 / adenylate kinase [Dendrobium catenatum]|uniref:Transcription initiation factor TFIID subunit 9 / adenylate kinase n=1 Tax=Dendrobium catenatum TaxID=906689 RepID=A0A2I0WPN8_9ASPA|nr:transcription initiation factor TFIID subunit 9 / adenylate kinase [Dendrobium catenatum]